MYVGGHRSETFLKFPASGIIILKWHPYPNLLVYYSNTASPSLPPTVVATKVQSRSKPGFQENFWQLRLDCFYSTYTKSITRMFYSKEKTKLDSTVVSKIFYILLEKYFQCCFNENSISVWFLLDSAKIVVDSSIFFLLRLSRYLQEKNVAI